MKALRCSVLVAAVCAAVLSFIPVAAAGTPEECNAAIDTVLGALEDCENGDIDACRYVDEGGWDWLMAACNVY